MLTQISNTNTSGFVSSSEAAQGSDEEEEEGGRQGIHFSSVFFCSPEGLKGHRFQRGLLRFSPRSERPLRGWRRRMDAGEEQRGCRAFLLLEARLLTASSQERFRLKPFTINLTILACSANWEVYFP
ncbi:hypothetical protein ATANTOWER_017779 [Ataeniobius toweri]|uniref:Uncharacterized protein n=1 Tax=Ataeniobius toweri TaxID=208326 RepID=A0ABU7B784_9TELE|nr:hypothetical protein [Ataeniobius toweri]